MRRVVISSPHDWRIGFLLVVHADSLTRLADVAWPLRPLVTLKGHDRSLHLATAGANRRKRLSMPDLRNSLVTRRYCWLRRSVWGASGQEGAYQPSMPKSRKSGALPGL